MKPITCISRGEFDPALVGELVNIANGPRGHERNARKEACGIGIVVKIINSYYLEILWADGTLESEKVRDLEMAA
ncbi:hypothetical protein CL634_09930 [bacterium]|nr:hypothetical protein [bacterium]